MTETEAALRRAVAALGRPANLLHMLDRRPLLFAFVPGEYEVVTLRDLASGDVLDVAIDVSSGDMVDPAGLQRLNRERAATHDELSPELAELLLRHPELLAVRVRVRRPSGGPEVMSLSVPDIVALAERGASLELVDDPEVAD